MSASLEVMWIGPKMECWKIVAAYFPAPACSMETGAIITRIILSNDFIPFLQEIYENEKLSIKLK